jgi:single-stranded-DNA-specific exonuclease
MKKWNVISTTGHSKTPISNEDIISLLLTNRGIKSKKEQEQFLHPKNPFDFTPDDVDIDRVMLQKGLHRIQKAIQKKESIVVYADYDADGITAGAILWETLHELGANVMPYIPHRVDEGYGLSKKGIDAVVSLYHPTLIITVDHGITAREQVAYAQSLGIETIITDHHVKPEKLPECIIIHTTTLSGAGVSWFVSKELDAGKNIERVILAAIGTIADMVPLVGPNRSIAKFGLEGLNHTKRVGLVALMNEAGLTTGALSTYDISHVLAPRLNAMGRLVHAMDALRLLCTIKENRATELAAMLGDTNKERQQLTIDTTIHAKELVRTTHGKGNTKKLIFISHGSYNPGIIGLVAGKLVEEYYLPSIVLSQGDIVSKASARSIPGFNIVEAIRMCSDILVDVGGHPMAAGFTVETKHLALLQTRLEDIAEKALDETMLIRTLRIDMEIPLNQVTEKLWESLRSFEPYGFGNSEPLFTTRGVHIVEAKLVGAEGKHLKLKVSQSGVFDAIAFGMGAIYSKLRPDTTIDIAYSIDMNVWNGSKKLQLKVKDIIL